MDIEKAIETLRNAVQQANGAVLTHPLKTRDVESALRVMERLAAPLRRQRTPVIGHRPPQREWVIEKYD